MSKNTQKLLQGLIDVLMVGLAACLLFSFVAMDLNPENWPPDWRAIIGVTVVAASILSILSRD